VIACVAVVGTTEESAVDRVDLVVECRRRAAERGMAFHLHADAAWGGYAVAITRDGEGARRSYEEALADAVPEVWPREGVYKALCAVEATDSITIDPHKLGYVPYPAGAVCFRDRRCRDLLAVDAPYLFHRGQSEWVTLGRYIFEGSKPGAAAAAVWMSHKVLPLDARGYGRLICDASRGALALHRRLLGGDWGAFRLSLLPQPDLNIVCFGLGHGDLATLEECNDLVDRVYAAMSVGVGHPAPQLDYFVTQTVLRWDQYGESTAEVVAGLGFSLEDCRRAGGVHVVRCTVMDPFLVDRRAGVDHIEGFARCLRGVLEAQLDAR
jgi:glutamate/tyrosine decarboxylase-like PLP-dependent enzyme